MRREIQDSIAGLSTSPADVTRLQSGHGRPKTLYTATADQLSCQFYSSSRCCRLQVQQSLTCNHFSSSMSVTFYVLHSFV